MAKKVVCATLAIAALVLGTVGSSDAWGGRPRVGVGVFVGPGFWWGRPAWGPWWGYPCYYPYYPAYVYPPPAYYTPSVVAPATPPAYVQQEPPPYYWYYCQASQAYYPYVRECPAGWMKVVPSTAEPPGGGGPPAAREPGS
jgi:hypothetical protein